VAERLSVNLNPQTAASLRYWAAQRETTITEVVRRAVAVYDFVERETAAGHRLQVDQGDTIQHVELL
jgi:hypothetical protein